MRLGLVVYGDIGTISGGYLYDRKLVEHLTRRGDKVVVISLPRESYLKSLGHNFSGDLLKALGELQVDALLEDELCHPSLFRLNRKLKEKSKHPIVCLAHHLRSSETGSWPGKALFRMIEKDFLSTIDGFIFASDDSAKSIRVLSDRDVPGVVAVPGRDIHEQAIDLDQVRARARGGGPLRLLFVGNLIPRKGLHFLLQALYAISQSNWYLTIVGGDSLDPDYAGKIESLIKGFGLEQKVERFGILEGEELWDQYRKAHVLAVPSTYEGYGIAYLEAMRFGLPVIGSARGGAKELVTDRLNGFLVEPGDVKAIALHIDELAGDRELLERMSLKALERYSEQPTWETSLGRAREYLLGLIDKGE